MQDGIYKITVNLISSGNKACSAIDEWGKKEGRVIMVSYIDSYSTESYIFKMVGRSV